MTGRLVWIISSALFFIRLMVGSLVLMSIPITAIALPPNEITSEEMALSPPYCPYAQTFWGSGKPESKQWRARMGPAFDAIHHYCWGQINVQRALRSSTPRQQRQHLLSTAVNDYSFVIRNASIVDRKFVLLPEILTKRGDVQLLLSLPRDANKSFAEARALKPDYWPAYSSWAEYLVKVGKRSEARLLVKAGLEYSPSSRTLGELYRLLGGDPSAISPKVKEPSPDGVKFGTSVPGSEKETAGTMDSKEALNRGSVN